MDEILENVLETFFDLPWGTATAKRLKIPLNTIDPNASHLLPHRSNTIVKKVSAGNSVTVAIVNVIKISNPKEPTFRTCPSNTKETAIQITISKIVTFLKRGVLNKSKTEYELLFSSSFNALAQLVCKRKHKSNTRKTKTIAYLHWIVCKFLQVLEFCWSFQTFSI